MRRLVGVTVRAGQLVFGDAEVTGQDHEVVPVGQRARVRDRERRQQLLGTGVRGSTISDRKGGWGATRGYPRLTPRHPAHRLFEIALLDAI